MNNTPTTTMMATPTNRNKRSQSPTTPSNDDAPTGFLGHFLGYFSTAKKPAKRQKIEQNTNTSTPLKNATPTTPAVTQQATNAPKTAPEFTLKTPLKFHSPLSATPYRRPATSRPSRSSQAQAQRQRQTTQAASVDRVRQTRRRYSQGTTPFRVPSNQSALKSYRFQSSKARRRSITSTISVAKRSAPRSKLLSANSESRKNLPKHLTGEGKPLFDAEFMERVRPHYARKPEKEEKMEFKTVLGARPIAPAALIAHHGSANVSNSNRQKTSRLRVQASPLLMTSPQQQMMSPTMTESPPVKKMPQMAESLDYPIYPGNSLVAEDARDLFDVGDDEEPIVWSQLNVSGYEVLDKEDVVAALKPPPESDVKPDSTKLGEFDIINVVEHSIPLH